MADDAPPTGAIGGKRRRDVTNYVVMRRPRPLVVGRAPQADVDAEAFARFVGSWGNFSAHVGHRWEQLASEAAEARLGQPVHFGDTAYTLNHVEELDRDHELHREVERVGVSCPDALFRGRDAAGRVVIQPVDYKVSLDTASFDQVEASRILDLATRGGERTVAAIWRAVGQATDAPEPADGARAALLAQLAEGALQPVDGIFVAPDTAFNRVHLRSPQNRQRERPLRPADVLLVSAVPARFFGDLPGHAEARLLMQADHVRADLPGDLGMAERYARLGSGARGALLTVRTPLFGPPPEDDTAGELRELLRQHATSADMLRHLQGRRAERLELLKRRDQLLRFPFRIAALADALGRPPAAPEGTPAWPAELLRAGIGALHAAHRERVAERGAQLLASGLDDATVLERLEAEWQQFRRAARADIERWAQAQREARN